MRKWNSCVVLGAAALVWAAAAQMWPPQPPPRIELRGSESGGAFVEDAPGWSPHLVTLFLPEKNPDGPWHSARQHIEWAHRPAHSYVADGSGALVIIAHPTLRQFDQITSLDLDAMEVNHSGNAEPFEELWDRVLTWRVSRNLKPMWGSGADDTHSISDIDRSWIALRLPSLTEAEVKGALRRGAFYASNGPVIRDIQVEGGTVTVSLAEAGDVRWLRSGQFGIGPAQPEREAGLNRCLRVDKGTARSSYTLNAEDGTADPKALFIRCVVTTGEAGKAAQTQPFVIRAGGRLDNPYPARGDWHKGMTHNHTDHLEGDDGAVERYHAAYAARGHSAEFETEYDYWVTPMIHYPGGRTPEIAEVAPGAFGAAEPVSFEIRGKDFQDGCEVAVDGAAVRGAKRISDSAIRVSVPGKLAPGSHELTVRNPNGLQDTRTHGFRVREQAAATGGWTSYTPSNSPLGSHYVYSLAPDPRGGIWVGTNRGLNYFDGREWKLFREPPRGGLDDTIYDVDPSAGDGSCWFTCFRGIGVENADGSRRRWNWKEAALPSKQVNQILRTDGATYASCHNRQGFAMFRDGKWTSVALPETARGLVTSILQGPDGNIWLGTKDGVLRWNPAGGAGAWKHYTRDNSGLPDPFVRRMAFDSRGRLWAGTAARAESEAGGLCVLEDGRWRTYSRGNSPLPERRVWSVYVDAAGGVWAATSKGAACLRPDGTWLVLNAANSGLLDDMVTDIAQDKAGNMWFATASGVSRMAAKPSR